MTVYTKGRNFLIGFGLCYLVFIACLLQESVQTHVFYLHRIRWSTRDLQSPAKFGFSSSRAASFFIEERIHAWHIAPVGRHQAAQIDNSQRIIIYFHGTAGTLAFPHRLTSYRIFSALPDTHVLAIDYRGFGLSPGHPSEPGLIADGVAAVEWALERGFLSRNIILYGQSLGSAVALGVAHNLSLRKKNPVEIAKVVTVAAFESGTEIIKTYRLGGVIPMLEPLRTYPMVQSWLIKKLNHLWNSLERVKDLAQQTSIQISFGHSMTDYEISHVHSERLFEQAVEALSSRQVGTVESEETDDGGLVKRFQNRFLYRAVHWGGHNQVQWDDKLLMDIL